MKETERDTVEATLVMELNVECPGCKHYFDLFKTAENSDGSLLGEVLDDDWWEIDASERIDSCTRCPECGIDFDVKGVLW